MKRIHCILLIVLLVINFDSHCWSFLFEEEEYENDLVVETRLGKVLGRKDGKVNAYLGIPYAEPPLGRYRFRPTRPKRPWYPAVLKAYEFGPECLQSTLFFDQDESRKRIMDEDCLFLNIWQPQKHPVNGDLWPVMVWIYGGAFIHGGSSQPEYNGKYLAEKGVIVVSLNYRLGALGFLVSVSDGLFGNYGLDDQKTALQWIRDNIRAFNGDPDRITLFGESAGAMSIGLHLFDQEFSLQQYQQELKSSSSTTTPPPTRPKQLFHSIILQSNPFGYKYRNLAIANFIGSSYKELLDCEDLKCLQSESPEELIHVQDTLMAVPRSIGDFFAWGPIITTDDHYLREMKAHHGIPVSNITIYQPMQAMKELKKISIPIIMGTTLHEGNVFVFTAFPNRMNQFLYKFLILSFFRQSSFNVLTMYSSKMKNIENSPYPDYRLLLSEILSDYLFHCPNQFIANSFMKLGSSVFLYKFSLETKIPGFSCCNGLSCHSCDLPYAFNQLEVIEKEYAWVSMPSNYFQRRDQAKRRKSSSSSSSRENPLKRTERIRRGFDGSAEREQQQEQQLQQQHQQHQEDIFPEIFGSPYEYYQKYPKDGSHHPSNQNNNNDTKLSTVDVDEGRELSYEEIMNNRRKIDAEVARVMTDYWTSFATYGDPNGDLMYFDTNGKLLGKHPKEVPFWPKLWGDFSSFDSLQALYQQLNPSLSQQLTQENPPEQEAKQDDSDHPSQSSSSPSSSSSSSTESVLHLEDLSPLSTILTQNQENSQVMAYYYDASSFTTEQITNLVMNHPHSLSSGSSSSMSAVLPDLSNQMQQLIFHQNSYVSAIEPDCICNQWNHLEYKF